MPNSISYGLLKIRSPTTSNFLFFEDNLFKVPRRNGGTSKSSKFNQPLSWRMNEQGGKPSISSIPEVGTLPGRQVKGPVFNERVGARISCCVVVVRPTEEFLEYDDRHIFLIEGRIVCENTYEEGESFLAGVTIIVDII